MAKKKEVAAAKEKDPAKEAKKKARLEAIKNRPAGQRCNSKSIDRIELENGNVIETFGYPVSAKRAHIGILTTTVTKDAEGNVVSVATTWIPGDLTIKAKKGHGNITGAKKKGDKSEEEEEEEEEGTPAKEEAPAKESKKKSKKKED